MKHRGNQVDESSSELLGHDTAEFKPRKDNYPPSRTLVFFTRVFVWSYVLSVLALALVLQCLTIQCCPEGNHGNHGNPKLNELNNSESKNPLMVVTVASAQYFDRLENFVGSFHVWAPGQPILIYDLGLTTSQLREISCWHLVTLRAFNFSAYPAHVRNLYNYAYKPLLIHEVGREFDQILVLDAGVELRQALTPILHKIQTRGYLLGIQAYNVGQRTHPQMFAKLRPIRDEARIQGLPFCSGGIQAYDTTGRIYRDIIPRIVACALDEDCIAPHGSGRGIHNYDQSALSIVAYDVGASCTTDRRYCEDDMAEPTLNGHEQNHVILALRRWKNPKPYVSDVRLDRTCIPHVPQYHLEAQEHVQIIETTQQFRIGLNSELQKCLQEHDNSRPKCAHLIPQGIPFSPHYVFTMIEQIARRFRVLVIKASQCRLTYALSMVFVVLHYLQQQQKHPRPVRDSTKFQV